MKYEILNLYGISNLIKKQDNLVYYILPNVPLRLMIFCVFVRYVYLHLTRVNYVSVCLLTRYHLVEKMVTKLQINLTNILQPFSKS